MNEQHVAQPTPDRCGECNAVILPGAAKCWLCGAELDALEFGDSATAAENQTVPSRTVPRFRLSSLMLIVTLVCLCLGMADVAPGLIPFIVVAGLAWLRTAGFVRFRREAGSEPTTEDKVGTFMGSVGVVLLLGIAFGCAFFVTCFVGFWGGMYASETAGARGMEPVVYGSYIGFALGIPFGCWALYRAGRRLWPTQNILSTERRSQES